MSLIYSIFLLLLIINEMHFVKQKKMDEEREEIVTKFLINTSRLCPQFSVPTAQAALTCAAIAALHPVDDPGAHLIPLTTGSVAEFYIEPMLPHVGDIDVMYHRSTELAIRQGQSPPTQLPAEFSNNVKVYEIVVDSDFPGYVYLQLRYLLTECNDDSKYNAVEYDRNQRMWYSSSPDYLNFGNFDIVVRRGPAVTNASFFAGLFSYDDVFCVRCLSWPPQAIDWPTRHRNYGWPDSATVDCVVNNGCDVVGVAHRQCRQD